MLKRNASPKQPFVGLRPFDYDDWEFFFGRDMAIRAVERLVLTNRFVAIVGSSGTGKSSLVRAGLLPKLEAREDEVWRCQTMEPGDSPIRRLALAISQLRSNPDELRDAWDERIEFRLRTSKLGICEAISLFPPEDRNCQFLLIVDQFEELFRFADLRTEAGGSSATAAMNRDEATAFVRLILEANSLDLFPIHVVITMRSDFIGDCSRFHDLPEMVSKHQFLVPGLTRDERATAITGPLEKAGASIDPELVQRLLNDTNEDPDQLPIIQHAMMRCWRSATQRTPPGEPIRIEVSDYAKTGGVADALSVHADEVLDGLSADSATDAAAPFRPLIAKRLFQALTEVDRNGRVTRRPLTFGALKACVSSADWDPAEADRETRLVLERFAAPDCCFLKVTNSGALQDDSIVDIGHEALIRRWNKLKGEGDIDWIREEQEDAERYRDLIRRARADGIIAGAELDDYERWWTERRPTEAWAKRYSPEGGAYLESVAQALERSRKARDEERETKRLATDARRAQLEATAAKAQAEAATAQADAQKARAAVAEAETALERQRAANTRWTLVGALGALVVVAAVVFVVLQKWNFQEQRQRLVLAAVNAVRDEPQLVGTADALNILRSAPSPTWDHDFFRAVYKTLESLREVRRIEVLMPDKAAPATALGAEDDTQGAQAPAKPPVNSPPVVSVSVNPKAPILVALSGNLLHFIKFEKGGAAVEHLLSVASPVNIPGWGTARWSPDGQKLYIAGFRERGAIWQPCGQAALRPFLGSCADKTGDETIFAGGANAQAGMGTWSTDGKYILTGGFGARAHAWNADTGEAAPLDAVIDGAAKQGKQGKPVTLVAISPTGKYRAQAGVDRESTIAIRTADPEQEPVAELKHGEPGLSLLMFNPGNDGQLLTVSQNGTNFWNLDRDDRRPQQFKQPGATDMQAAFAPNGTFFVTASNDRSLGLREIENGTARDADRLRGHKGPVFAVDVASDGTIVSGSADGSIRFWRRDPVRLANYPRPERAEDVEPLKATMAEHLPFVGYGTKRIELPLPIKCTLNDSCPKEPGATEPWWRWLERKLFAAT